MRTHAPQPLGPEVGKLGLGMLGGFTPQPDDNMPDWAACIVLLGPNGAAWDQISAAPEFHDGAPDPLDRWSERVLSALAATLSAQAFFPFGGPPWQPFQTWAQRTGRAVASPIGFLCHADQGLMVSFRGALALPFVPTDLPTPAADPCTACASQPCRSACPTAALTEAGYDVAKCHSWLASGNTPACKTQGCAVRLACPVSAGAQRSKTQSAFHMKAFHK